MTAPKSRQSGSKTGLVPRIDVEPEALHESPQPPEAPELPDASSASITGKLPRLSQEEVEDAAKQSDDSASTPG